jgi:hypothetical protein
MGMSQSYPQACLTRPGLVKPFVLVLAGDPVELSNEGVNSLGEGGQPKELVIVPLELPQVSGLLSWRVSPSKAMRYPLLELCDEGVDAHQRRPWTTRKILASRSKIRYAWAAASGASAVARAVDLLQSVATKVP